MRNPYECHYCGKDGIMLLTDGTCSQQECQAQLHRSYGDEAFAEFCEREGMHPEDWDEFFAEADCQRIDDRIQKNAQKANAALQDLLHVLDDEHKIGRSIIELRNIRYTRKQLNEALEAVNKASKYRAKRD